MPAAEDLPAATREAVLAAVRQPVLMGATWAAERSWYDERMLRRLPRPAAAADLALHARLLDQVFLGMTGAPADRFDRTLLADLAGSAFAGSVPATYLGWLHAPVGRDYEAGSAFQVVLQKPGGRPLEWPCPLRFQVRAAQIYAWRHADKPADIAQADQLAGDLANRLLAAEKAGEFGGHDRLIYRLVAHWPDWENPAGKHRLAAGIDALAARRGDDWLGSMLRGHRSFDRAWDARGNGFAATVTEEGWKAFRAGLGEAETSLTRAWELAPERPEAAALMVGVAGAHQTREPIDTWFARALAAGIDDIPVWTTRASYLRPRWGGSRQAMLDLAVLALEQAPPGSFLPRVSIDILHDIAGDGIGAEDERAARAFAARPPALECCRKAVERLERDFGPVVGASARTSEVMLLWSVGQRQRATELLRSIPAPLRVWSKCRAWRVDERELRAAVGDADPAGATSGEPREEVGGSAF